MNEFVESNALIAVMDGDRDEAFRLVRGLLPGERMLLTAAIDDLFDILRLVGRESPSSHPSGAEK